MHRMFQKDHRGESVTVSSEGLDAYNDSVQQDRIQRFSDSCDRMLQGELDVEASATETLMGDNGR